MCLQGSLTNNLEQEMVKEFANWILNIKDGKHGELDDREVAINVLNDLLIKNSLNPVKAITMSTYLTLMENNVNKDTLCDSTILTPKLNIVDEVNSYMMSLIISDEKDYLSLKFSK